MLRKLFHKMIEGNINRENGENRTTKIARRLFLRAKRVERGTILFLSSNAGPHPELQAIAAAITNRKLPSKLYWAARDTSCQPQLPKQFKVVPYGSYKFFRLLSVSQILIDDSFGFSSLNLQKKSNQILIQTWDDTFHKAQLPRRCQKEADYCIAGSILEMEFYRSSFWAEVPMLCYGHTRNDLLSAVDERTDRQLRQKTHKELGIAPNHRIFFYRTSTPETLSEQKRRDLKSALEARFSGDWSIIIENTCEFPVYADIYLCEDCVHILDYMLSQRPCFVLAAKGNSQPFFPAISAGPFPIADTIEGVIEQIRQFDIDAYKHKLHLFFRKYGVIEDGQAGERIADKIQRIIERPDI